VTNDNSFNASHEENRRHFKTGLGIVKYEVPLLNLCSLIVKLLCEMTSCLAPVNMLAMSTKWMVEFLLVGKKRV
jgi:hypothetical protein